MSEAHRPTSRSREIALRAKVGKIRIARLETIRFPVIISLLAVYMIWGSTYLGIRIALESFPPFMMGGIRLLIAGTILLTILRLRETAWPTVIEARNAAFIGAIMFGGGLGLVTFAEQWVASGLAALAAAAIPIWTAIFAGLWGRWPSRLEWVGLLIGLTGVVLLNMENGMQSNPMGSVALLIGPILWSFASMLSRRIAMPEGFTAIMFELFGGGAIMTVISIISQESMMEYPTVRSVIVMIYLTIMGSIVGFSAYMYLLRSVRPALATSYAYINPVIAVILGITLASETITSTGVIAMFVILSGVALLAFAKERSDGTQNA
jgi:drug/metabolite transporter (DMT)-like permease